MAKIKGTIWLKKFDPAADYLVHRPMTVQGRKFATGEPFDKELVPTRRLRQLYEGRKILAASPEHIANLKAIAGDTPPAEKEPRASKRRGKPARAKAKAPAKGKKAGKAAKAPQERQNLPQSGDAPVSVPADWLNLPWSEKRSLAAKFGPAKNKAEAEATIAAEVERRGKPA